jgi:hypothetical protein
MHKKSRGVQMLALKRPHFSIQGARKLCLKDEYDQLRELTGKILVARDSEYHGVYVEVTNSGRQFLMPIQSVNSIE